MPRTKLPQVLEDEILARAPPRSLSRFRTVCQRWNTLVDDKRFIKRHLDCVSPQFILRTHDSKIYSIGINLDDSLEVRELNLETQGPKELMLYRNMYHFDGFLLCPNLCPNLPDELAIWNPWVKQEIKWIEPKLKRRRFNFYGLGYDNSRSDKCYKILGLNYRIAYDGLSREEVRAGRTILYPRVSIYEFATNAWKDLDIGPIDWYYLSRGTVLSLNGTLYWIAAKNDARDTFVRSTFVQSFDFCTERFKPFCLLPPTKGTKILGVFRGDRLSVLEQVTTPRKINVWVTKNKISGDSNELVSWSLLMTVSIPNFPKLENLLRSNSRASYFIDNNNDKRLIVCTCDEESGKPCIYIVKGDSFNKVEIGFEVKPWPFHVVYIPSLVPIPLPQELQS